MSGRRAQVLLDVQHLRKTYGGVVALDDVSLQVRAGEVHALLGQNGCGKSTLVKSLTGLVVPDSGEVMLFGKRVQFPLLDPHRHGIAVIHQDVGVVDSMTVLENLGASARYGSRLLGPVSVRKERSVYVALMDRLGFQFDLDAKVSTLSPAERALLAVLRAMRLLDGDADRQLFVLDEPTAALSRPEAARLLGLMRRVADSGSAVMFISHRLAEVMEVCDRATVMRAGRDVTGVVIAETSRPDLVATMLGRRMDDFYPDPPASTGSEVRLAADLVTGAKASDVSLEVRSGEIVGVTGLAGMGQEELPMLLSGARTLRSGSIRIDGDTVDLSGPRDAMARGLVLVPGNRLRDGIWLGGTAAENVTLPVLRRFSGFLGIRRSSVMTRARELMSSVQVHPNRPSLPMSAFSGGNQQKIVFAKWLQMEPRILVLDEPIQGVDPGAAKELLTTAARSAAAGAAVLMCSGDHEMLAATCHRVLVLHHGRLVAELTGAALTESGLMDACESEPATAA